MSASRVNFDTHVQERYEALQPAAQRVIRYIAANRLAVLSASAAEIARHAGASDATVIRAVKALGFASIGDLRTALAASLSQEAGAVSAMLRIADEVGNEVEEVVASIFETHRENLLELSDAKIQSAVARAARLLGRLDRVLVFGIGPSGPLSEYVVLLLNRHGKMARAINATGNNLADQLVDLKSGDGILALAYGRKYAEVQLVFEEAKRLHLPLVLVTDSLEPKLAKHADVIVPARRGRQGRVAMHGVTLMVLEAIALSMALADRATAIQSLARVGDLRLRLANLDRQTPVLKKTP